jgi:hypothetical protein
MPAIAESMAAWVIMAPCKAGGPRAIVDSILGRGQALPVKDVGEGEEGEEDVLGPQEIGLDKVEEGLERRDTRQDVGVREHDTLQPTGQGTQTGRAGRGLTGREVDAIVGNMPASIAESCHTLPKCTSHPPIKGTHAGVEPEVKEKNISTKRIPNPTRSPPASPEMTKNNTLRQQLRANTHRDNKGDTQARTTRRHTNINKEPLTLGSPVVPLVYMMVHRSSGLGGTAAQGECKRECVCVCVLLMLMLMG